MNRRLTIWAGMTVLLMAAGVCGADEVFPVAHNEAIAVRVLSGKDGKPQAGAHVRLIAGYDRRDLGLGLWREEAVTDGSGAVRLTNALRNLPLLRVEVMKRRSCEKDAGNAAFSIETMRRDGLSTANDCGTFAAEDARGVFTVFVKGGKASAQPGANAGRTRAEIAGK